MRLHSVPPISGEGKVGDLLSTISTQPRTNTVERRVKRCAVLASMGWPVCMARHLASFLIWSTATGCQPPRDSATMGKKAMLAALPIIGF